MSIRLMVDVWDSVVFSSQQEKLVMLCLADHANDEGICWPSVARIARRSILSERTVQRMLRVFEERGLIQRDPRKGRTTIYQICRERLVEGGDSVSPVTPSSHPRGDTNTVTTRGDTAVSPEPPYEPPLKPSVKDSSPTGLTISQQWVELLSNVCSIDPSLNGGRLAKRGMALQKAGYTLAQVEAGYSKDGWWYRSDWRGRQGQPPKPEDILATIKQVTSESAFMPATEDGRLAAVAQPEKSSREIAFEDGRMIPMGSDR